MSGRSSPEIFEQSQHTFSQSGKYPSDCGEICILNSACPRGKGLRS